MGQQKSGLSEVAFGFRHEAGMLFEELGELFDELFFGHHRRPFY